MRMQLLYDRIVSHLSTFSKSSIHTTSVVVLKYLM